MHSVRETSIIENFDLRRRTRIGGLWVGGYIGVGNRKLLRACFSSDQRYIICGRFSGSRKAPFEEHFGTTIWTADSKKMVFDSTRGSTQAMSVADAKRVIHSCNQKANRFWPFALKNNFTNACPTQCSRCSKKLDVDTILNYVPEQ